jgi:hypothetical protein
MDAPELVALEPLPRVEQSPLQALAKGSETSTATPPKQETPKRLRKRQRAEARAEPEQRPWGIGADWNDRRRNDNRYGQDRRYRDNERYWQGWQGGYRAW